jgi:hypothetical protein
MIVIVGWADAVDLLLKRSKAATCPLPENPESEPSKLKPQLRFFLSVFVPSVVGGHPINTSTFRSENISSTNYLRFTPSPLILPTTIQRRAKEGARSSRNQVLVIVVCGIMNLRPTVRGAPYFGRD